MNIDWALLKRSIISDLSVEEQCILRNWLEESSQHQELYRNIKSFYADPESFRSDEERKLQFRLEFENRIQYEEKKKRKQHILWWVKIAASFMLPIGLSVFLLFSNSQRQDVESAVQHTIVPGSRKAVLITHDGRNVQLDREVPVVEMAGGMVVRNDQNELIYSDSSADVDQQMENQLVIPRGGEYTVQLSDGTKIWLNSASELKYPVHFSDRSRRVFLKGEAYFQVAHQSKNPFLVVTDDVEVKVYGTEFNINTRAGNGVQTTLVRGSVSIRSGNSPEQMMKPEQMAEYNRENGEMVIRQVDVMNYIGWKSGIYVFEDKTIGQIMEELALWYDVNVFFQNHISKEQRFSGSLPRYREIGEMLSVISKTSHVKFEVKGNTVVVL